MKAYYNEIDPYASHWLKNLISTGQIAAGDVDERSIEDVRADDLRGYTQCHFFAGIGGWSIALRSAGWDDTTPVWTGSCPCQPFSNAGKGKGFEDGRHLWPMWFRLIQELHPSVVFGEQVEAAIRHGWLDEVQDGMESQGYSFGTAVLPSCSVGSPHKRDRLWFVGSDSSSYRSQRQLQQSSLGSNGPSETLSSLPLSQWKDQYISTPYVCGVADGLFRKSHKIRAYGNAIVPQVASQFISAFMECSE